MLELAGGCIMMSNMMAVRRSLALQTTLRSPGPPRSSSSVSGGTANSSSAWASTASSWGDWQAAHWHQEPIVTYAGPPPLLSWEPEACQQCGQNRDLLLRARRVEGQGRRAGPTTRGAGGSCPALVQAKPRARSVLPGFVPAHSLG